jgi:hypothetical protein
MLSVTLRLPGLKCNLPVDRRNKRKRQNISTGRCREDFRFKTFSDSLKCWDNLQLDVPGQQLIEGFIAPGIQIGQSFK